MYSVGMDALRSFLRYTVPTKVKCPFCTPERRHQDREDMRVTPVADGALYFCHHCNREGKVWREEIRERKPVPAKQTKHEAFDNDAAIYLKQRGISQATWERYSVYTASTYFPDSGEGKAIGYPYFKGSKPYGAKLRSVGGKSFVCTNQLSTMFGAQLVDLTVANYIVICEGENDALAMAEAGIANAISVPNGSGSFSYSKGGDEQKKMGFLWELRKEIEKAERIYLAVDMDEAGEKLMEELARRIGKHRIWLVKYGEGCKDANECLIRYGAGVLKDYFELAEPYPVEGLYEAEYFDDLVAKLYDEGFGDKVSCGFKSVDKIYSVSPGMLTVITGIPGHGKSTFVDQLMINLSNSDPSYIHAVCSFENPPHIHIAKLVEMVCQKTFFNESYGQRITPEELATAKLWVSQHFKFLYQDSGAKATVASIMERMRAAIFRWGVRTIVIDPYNYIDRPKDLESETSWIDNMLTEFRLFAQANGVHIWFVAHPTKQMKLADGSYQPPKGYDLAGSAAWYSKPDFGLTVFRDENEGKTRIINWKTRFNWLGQQGEASLFYDMACRVFRDDLLDTIIPIGGWSYEQRREDRDRFWDN